MPRDREGNHMLDQHQAHEMVAQYMRHEGTASTTQEILDSGAVPRLQMYTVKPGKVSDSIFGGAGTYQDKTTGQRVEFENPPLNLPDGTPIRIMVRTDRISTHDINRGEIPFKDQILATNHNYMRRLLASWLGTSQLEVSGLEDTAVVIAAENLQLLPVENVLRAYMAKSTTETSLYVHYQRGERAFAGHQLPKGLVVNGPLPYVMDTPSTKSDAHDETCTPERLAELGLCTVQQYQQIRNAGLMAFGITTEFLRQRGIVLVDTKLEHGTNRRGKIVSQDEILTMDSSRFWLADDYAEQMRKLLTGEITELNPKSFSKEFARGFSKGEQGYTEEQRVAIAVRYIEGIQHLLDKPFVPDQRPRDTRVIDGLEKVVAHLLAA